MATTPLSVDDALDDPRLTLVGLFFEAHHGLSREIGAMLQDDAGLSPQWFEVLLRLGRSPDHRLRMSDLATQVTLTASGLTRVVDRLEESGLVERQTCPTDRRGSFAALTAAGLHKLREALPAHVEAIDRLLTSTLDDEERLQLEALLRKVRDRLYPEGTSGLPPCPSVGDQP
jgi:DNA-binding MarR family transcriptional regulator